MNTTTPSLSQSALNDLAAFSRDALERARIRHAANGQDMLAGFHWDGRRFVVEVMQHIVGEFRTMKEVTAFSMMHNRIY